MSRTEQIMGPARVVVRGDIPESLSGVPRYGDVLFLEARKLDECEWVLRVGAGRITLHSIRLGDWPIGAYVGWNRIITFWQALHEMLGSARPDHRMFRTGIKYVNRLALPNNRPLSEWLKLGGAAPSIAKGPTFVQYRQQWASLDGYSDLSALLEVHSIAIPHPQLASTHDGYQLSVDILNYNQLHAPEWAQVSTWMNRAHSAERAVFEEAITDQFRRYMTATG
jgi:uncharacterized protein (TIGR04255 family)